MTSTLPALQPLHPDQRKVLRWTAALNAGALLLPTLGLEALIRSQGWPGQSVPLLVWLLVTGWFVVPFPRRRASAWGYHLDEENLHVAHGLLVRRRTLVPLARVQHIDVAQGPIQRRYGLGTLVVHTAGVLSTAVSLPGLLHDDALAMRDAIRAQIRDDPQ